MIISLIVICFINEHAYFLILVTTIQFDFSIISSPKHAKASFNWIMFYLQLENNGCHNYHMICWLYLNIWYLLYTLVGFMLLGHPFLMDLFSIIVYIYFFMLFLVFLVPLICSAFFVYKNVWILWKTWFLPHKINPEYLIRLNNHCANVITKTLFEIIKDEKIKMLSLLGKDLVIKRGEVVWLQKYYSSQKTKMT